ncbi:MAG TPA: 1-(5-phosphoribosyl)-5-[(5-phosphoribosylamino)methylideneamino] imidazole-4-carboxamide isomerase, partial [Methylomirabilota bacterium]|nr:1-(5-phosphoribosyl)-5-[(5-phosphoribosylamino)methylideneamino] imidazole-4-carboxamide isomerase [Methylomirabilota bacterium]
EAGARRIHVVDLDGARSGARDNATAVARITAEAGVPVQVSGGIRSADIAAEVLRLGADRVIFGTAAVEAPDEVANAVAKFGRERVVVGVDAREGLIATRGWTTGTCLKAVDLMLRMVEVGVARFMYTDIERDGTLAHPNLAAIAGILEAIDRPIIVAGGIAEVPDLEALARLGVEAAVCGKAIYTGAIDLAEAIRRVAEISS